MEFVIQERGFEAGIFSPAVESEATNRNLRRNFVRGPIDYEWDESPERYSKHDRRSSFLSLRDYSPGDERRSTNFSTLIDNSLIRRKTTGNSLLSGQFNKADQLSKSKDRKHVSRRYDSSDVDYDDFESHQKRSPDYELYEQREQYE